MENYKFALVTGASQGIGLACAKRLSQDGCRVVGVDIYQPTTVGSEFADFLTADVSNSSDCNKAVADAGQIDILVNSAGIVGPNMPFWDVTDGDWLQTMNINLTGTFNMMRAVVGQMRIRKWGRIVNIASIAGKEGNPNLAAYSASKAAVIGLTKSVGKELATEGILVNSIAPAVISTPINQKTDPKVLEYMIAKIPMSRVGQPEEVAALVSWLASDECSFSTGACYDISGGRATY
jgi:3-oxoacyl-[acyl-carrier protein] reductase